MNVETIDLSAFDLGTTEGRKAAVAQIDEKLKSRGSAFMKGLLDILGAVEERVTNPQGLDKLAIQTAEQIEKLSEAHDVLQSAAMQSEHGPEIFAYGEIAGKMVVAGAILHVAHDELVNAAARKLSREVREKQEAAEKDPAEAPTQPPPAPEAETTATAV